MWRDSYSMNRDLHYRKIQCIMTLHFHRDTYVTLIGRAILWEQLVLSWIPAWQNGEEAQVGNRTFSISYKKRCLIDNCTFN